MRLVDSTRDNTIIKTRNVASVGQFGWNTWNSRLPAWVGLGRGGERLTMTGRFRLEVLDGAILTYESGVHRGTIGVGTYFLEGETAHELYVMNPNTYVRALLTRLH